MPAEPGYTLLMNLGMGADMVRFVPGDPLPPKYQFRLDLEDGSGFTIRFWWFGYVHLGADDEMHAHAMTRDLGPSPLDPEFTADDFRGLVRRGRGMIKPFLLDQRHLSGIGNAYIHDILFRARIHPRRQIPGLSDAEIDALYASVRDVLGTAIVMGGAYYEKDFYGHPEATQQNTVSGLRRRATLPGLRRHDTQDQTGSIVLHMPAMPDTVGHLHASMWRPHATRHSSTHIS